MFALKKNQIMKALKIIGIILATLFVLVVLLSLLAPKNFRVERSIVIPTNNKEVIYKNISQWTEFLKWNPWLAKDPNAKIRISGQEGQVGSSYMWEGNKEIGKGEMTITSFKEFERVEEDLHFIKPFESTNKTIFRMKPEDNGYKVSWIIRGKYSFLFGIVAIFMDMEKMVGPDFEKGLNTLKEKCIADAAVSRETSSEN